MDIIKLEIKNLSPEEKEEFYNFFKEDSYYGIDLNQEWEKFKNYDALDKALEDYFRKYPNAFITFQAGISISLYNQKIGESDFKHLGYEDVVDSLTQEQKVKIIENIFLLAKYFKDEEGNDFTNEPYFKEFTEDEKKEIDQLQPENEEERKSIEGLKNSKYILVVFTSEDDREFLSFKNDDELILFALNDEDLAPRLLKRHWKILDPHYKVNRWIEKKYELELAKKEA
ncbi:hypothetical protein [Mesomycoplasma ovipneumoniae]|uniref:hypothetical protein n=1 Tax=Mesomycoplasma ovipneumoniae TaxID=29562 RepID=UPI00311B2D1C